MPIEYSDQEIIAMLREDLRLYREGEAIVMPKNREHAEKMLLVASKYLEDNPNLND